MQRALLAVIALPGLFSSPSYADQNLLPNGDFSVANKLTGWSNTTPDDFDPTLDADGNPQSGSLQLKVLPNKYAGPTSACFSVVPGSAYNYGGQSTLSKLFDLGGRMSTYMTCSVYPNTNCSGNGTPLNDPLVISPTIFAVNVFSSPQSTTGIVPSDAISADCELYATYFTNLTETPNPVNVDNLFFNSIAPTASVTVDGYMSGSWYDPAQSGHGFDIDITDQDNQVVAYWFNYAPDGSGKQVWFYAQGTYDSTRNSVTLDAGITSGARFPPMFNSGDVTLTRWGTITFTFTDCNHGTASWKSTLPGYGSGSIPITRLTHIKGTACAR